MQRIYFFIFLFTVFQCPTIVAQVAVKYFQKGNDTTKYKIINSQIKLEKKQRDVTLFFDNPNNILSIKYRLKGLENKWHSCHCQEVNYAHIEGGEFTFAAHVEGNEKRLTKIKIEVEPAFYEKWWFAPSLFLYLILVVGSILYIFMNYRLRQQLRLQSVRHELEIKALRAQMNPHFIFNCMNTIDAYILRKKFLEASDYLQKFSKLIRKILENSESQTISIEQEIQTLKLYIELEQERFSHSFVSYFDVESELMSNDYQIPSLVLQPFVENSILHGIRHLTERKGLISIVLKKMKKIGRAHV